MCATRGPRRSCRPGRTEWILDEYREPTPVRDAGRRIPDGKIPIPGVVTHATNIVEHPVLVAERITRYADRLGAENVIAGDLGVQDLTGPSRAVCGGCFVLVAWLYRPGNAP